MFTDICEQMRTASSLGHKILAQGGLKNYIGCLQDRFQENVYDQLFNLLIGEHVLLNNINFEIAKIGVAQAPAEAPVRDITDALSRNFRTDSSQLTYYRDSYLRLANLTNIVKKKMLRLPDCFFIGEWYARLT
jgi:hypothetical protein